MTGPSRGPHVLELLGPSTGGIRRHVAHLASHLRDRGWRVDVAGPAGVLADLAHQIPIPGGLDPRALVVSRRRLSEAMRGVDLVHAHGLKAGWLASTISPRPPLVVSVHNLVLDEVAGLNARVLRFLEGRVPGRVDSTIAVSRGVAERFSGARGADRIVVIPPAGPAPAPNRGPDEVRAALGVDPGDDLVVTAARLHPQKGLDVALAAAAQVVASRPRLRWFVFGEGPLRASLEAEASRLGLDGIVHFAGSRPDVDSELAAADVVVVPSLWESGPLVVLEALALGRPVVSTRVGLAADVLRPPLGRLVEVGDADGLARALVQALEELPTTGTQLSGSAAPFRPDALAAEVESHYREVLERR